MQFQELAGSNSFFAHELFTSKQAIEFFAKKQERKT
jgi:hypothetical protein|tara:strand:+ start:2669 stop:2776 length:108 start_codon:yes stop_codon:yes gene_type:complete